MTRPAGKRWANLCLVFGLQALLALVIALPVLVAIQSEAPLGLLDIAGASVAGRHGFRGRWRLAADALPR